MGPTDPKCVLHIDLHALSWQACATLLDCVVVVRVVVSVIGLCRWLVSVGVGVL